MNSDNGRINFASGIDNSQLRIDADESRNILQSISDSAVREGERMDNVFRTLGVTVAGAFSVSKAIEFGKAVVDVRQEIQGLEISFRTLLGNEAKANAMFGQIRKFAVETPMQLKDLASAAQMMLSFNIEEDKIMPYLKALGDVSMGDTQKFQSLSLAFSQMSSAGKLMGQDLMQMINAGFNPLAQMAEKTGKSINELKEEMSAGKITAEMVQQAFLDATSAGGKFNNMLMEQSKGIMGARSNLQGAIDDMMNELGQASEGMITGVLSSMTTLVKNYKEVAEVIGTLIAMFGAYKAALLVNEAITANVAANVVASYQSEINAINALLVAKAEETSATIQVETADLQEAVAKGVLTKAQADQVVMSRVALAERREALGMALQEMVAAENAAKQKLKLALQESVNAKKQLAIEQEKLMAMNAYELHVNGAAQKEAIHTASVNANSAAISVNNARKELATATANRQAAAQALETFGTQADTVSKGANTAATNFLTVAKNRLSIACKKLWATMTANPYGIILAAVVALAYGIYKLITYQTEYEKSLKKLDDATADFNKQAAKETLEIDTLFAKLKAAKEGTDAYKEAKEAIQSKYGKYLDSLSEEVRSLKDVAAAYKAVKEAALEAARARAMQAFTAQAQDDAATREGDIRTKLHKLLKDKYGDKTDANGMSIAEQVFAQIVNSKMFDPNSNTVIKEDFLRQFDVYHAGMVTPTGYVTPGYVTPGYTTNALQDLITGMNAVRSDYDRIMDEARVRFGDYSIKDDKKEEPAPELYSDGVAKARERFEKAQAEVERLKKDATATTKQVQDANAEVEAAKKALKDTYGIDVTAESRQGARDASRQEREDNQIAVQTAERLKKIQEYANSVAKAERQAEFDIRQAAIDAMDEGIERQIKQNQLNYDRLIFENQTRQTDMIEGFRDMMELKWENENPNAKKKGMVFDRSSVSDHILDEGFDISGYTEEEQAMLNQMRQQLVEYARIAAEAQQKANKDSLDTMLADVLTYEQQRTKTSEDFEKKRKQLYETDDEGNYVLNEDGSKKLRAGVTQGNADELQRQEDLALQAIDEEFAKREESYQAWCEAIASLSIEQLEAVLKDAKEALDEMLNDGDYQDTDLAVARAKVATAQMNLDKAKGKDNVSPNKRSIKEWQDLYKTLQDCEREFESIGDAVGGLAGEIIKTAGQIAASSLSMINGIVQLVNMSKVGIEGTAATGATAISTMEKASVILTIISAAMQIATKIISLFNHDNKKQEEIEALQERIDQLQWELNNAELNRYTTTEQAVARVRNALAETRAELIKAYRASGDFWGMFRTAFGSASNNVELLNRSAEKLAKTYANMSYTVDKALGADKYNEAKDQLKNLAQQQILIQEQINKEASKKKTDDGKINEWKQKIAELGQQALEIINGMVEDIIGGSASDIANELANAFISAFQEGEDAAKAWGEKVNEIVADITKRMLISKFLEEPLGDIFDKYKAKWFKDGQFTGLQSVIDSMSGFANDLNAVGQDFATIWESLPDNVRDMFTASGQFQQDASSKGFQAMSQDVGEELNGRFTAVQINSELIKDAMMVVRTTVEELRNISLLSMGYLESIDKNTRELYDINASLLKIVKYTQNL